MTDPRIEVMGIAEKSSRHATSIFFGKMTERLTESNFSLKLIRSQVDVAARLQTNSVTQDSTLDIIDDI